MTSTFAQHSVDEAIRVRMLISELLLLLDRESEETGIFSLDEYDTVLRYCVGAKVKHLLHTFSPGIATDHFPRLHTDLLDSCHLNVTPHQHLLTITPPNPSN